MTDPRNLSDIKAVISHDWLLSIGGGDRCAAIFAEMFPDAPVYTSIYRPELMAGLIDQSRIHTSFLDRFPEVLRERHRMLLPLMPSAFASFHIPKDTNLVLSSSHCAAKGIRKPKGASHVCFCYSPMRYVWDLYETYLHDMKGVTRAMFQMFAPMLRRWDVKSSGDVDVFIAISRFIAERIKRIYGRGSLVVYPPVDCKRFTIDDMVERREYFLILSRLVGYKRVDIAIEAFRDLPFLLRVAGTGPQMEELKAKAGPNIEFAGFIPEDKLADEYRRARGVIVTAVEDFGLVPLEAAACGTPTIAYGYGGYLETVTEGETGTFFAEQTPASLREAVLKFHRMSFNRGRVRNAALKFDIPRFRDEIADIALKAIAGLRA